MNKKILAAIGAVALCSSVAQADVESANVVGYQSVTAPIGWSLFTPTFKAVGGDIDLTDIKIVRTNGEAIPATTKNQDCKGAIYFQTINPGTSGSYNTTLYRWYSKFPNGGAWSKDAGATAISIGEVKIPNGTGFAINNGYSFSKTAEAVYLRVSGEVDLKCENNVAIGWSIMGNSTPVEVDLRDIKIVRMDGQPIPATTKNQDCKGAIYFQTINPGTSGSYNTTLYRWYSKFPNGGAWSIDAGATAIGETMIPAGTAFAINNGYSYSKTAEAVILVLPSPVK